MRVLRQAVHDTDPTWMAQLPGGRAGGAPQGLAASPRLAASGPGQTPPPPPGYAMHAGILQVSRSPGLTPPAFSTPPAVTRVASNRPRRPLLLDVCALHWR